MKKLFLVISLLFLNITLAENVETGIKAPSFFLESGDSKGISLDQLKNKTIIIIYETKDVVEQNRQLKNELKTLLANSAPLNAQCIILPVINCSQANWLTKGVWQSNLRKNSEKERIAIYGDWDGKMFSEYGIKDNESNVIIIDRNGIVRYFSSGKLGDDAISNIKELITIKH